MRLMTYNILESGEGRIDPLAECIRQANADAVILQETQDRLLLQKLADRLQMEFFLAENPRNADGPTALLSRLPIREAVNHAPLDDRLTRSAFHAIVRTPVGHDLPVIGLHLHARATVADEHIRLSELPAILDIATHFAGRPHLLAGDFNAVSPVQPIDPAKLRPKTRQQIAQQNNEFPREVISRLLAAGYVDAHALHHPPETMQHSFTTSHPATRVDFIFVSPDLAPAVNACDVFAAPIGRFASDHYPVVADIDI